MPHTVEVPDVGTIEFPDDMSEEQITGVLQKKFPPQPPVVQAKEPEQTIWQTLRQSGISPSERVSGIAPAPGFAGVSSDVRDNPQFQQWANTAMADLLPDVPPILKRSIMLNGTKKEQFLTGGYEGIKESINSLTSPENVNLLSGTAAAGAAGSIVPRLVALGFALHMGKHVSTDIAQQLGEEYAKPESERDQSKIGKLISEGTIEAGMAAGLAKASTPKPGEPAVTPSGASVYETPSQIPANVLGIPRLIENLKNLVGAPTGLPRPVINPSLPAVDIVPHAESQPQPENKGVPDATQERQIQEGNQPEYSGANALGQETEASNRNRDVGGGNVPPQEGQAPRPLLLTPESAQAEAIPPEPVSPPIVPQFLEKPVTEWTPEHIESLTPENRKAVTSQTIQALQDAGGETKLGPNATPETLSKAINEVVDLRAANQKAFVHLQAIDPSPTSRPLGIVAPGAVSSSFLDSALSSPVEALTKGMQRFWRGFSMQSAPRLTEANRLVGESGVRYAVAPDVARTKGTLFADKVTEGITDPAFDKKFGTALTEDNLRSIKDAYAKGGAIAAANKVRSLIGIKNSPFKTETEYQDFLNQAETKLAIERHKQLWEEEKDPIFRKANDLDPDLPLDSRGLQTGARINLKNVMEGEVTKTTVGPGARSNLIRQTSTLLRKDPFARQAKGTGQSYEGSYRELMAHGYEREYPVATQHDFINSMLESGVAKITEREFPKEMEIGGERAKAYLMRLRPWAGKFLQIPKSLAAEYESISGLTPASRIPYYTKAGEFFTKQSIAGLAEFSTHGANILTDAFLGVGPTANPMINALMKAGLRSDLLVRVPELIIKAFGDRRQEMLKLAEIGAGKRPYTGLMGGILNHIDQGTRLSAASIYKRFVDAGIFPDTETGLREFVNQTGAYNKKLQPLIIRWLRDTQVQPFATAHSTFLARGLREMVLAPGAKANSNAAAFALRAEKAAGVIGLVGIVATLNYLINGKVSGPPGTDLGSVGWIGDDGKLRQFSISKLTGMDRGIRQIGIKGAIEAKRVGLPLSSQLKAAASGAGGTAVQTVAGPINQFLAKATTGARPGVPMIQEAKIVAPQGDEFAPLKTQMAENIKTALQQANPAVDAILSRIQGKPLGDIAQKQLSRYTPRVGQSEQTIAALPKIVHSGEIKDYSEAVSKEARKLPLNERQRYIMQRFEDDGVQTKDKKAIMTEIKRRGTLKYK